MTQVDCPVCGHPNTPLIPGNAVPTIECKRCGDFAPTGTAFDLSKIWAEGKNPSMNPRGKYAVSHAIRKMQHGGRRPEISSDMLRVLWNQPRLNPQQQANAIVVAIGEADFPLNEYVYISNDALAAIAGTEDDVWKGKSAGLHLVVERLHNLGLIEYDKFPRGADPGYRLTFDGWAEFEKLRREVIDSRIAFMAMGYGDPNIARVVSEYFVPAVKEAGFDLFRLDEQPKSGVIDNRMRVNIRTAKFIVCDLTDENRGAYWEAGFAEGCEKPVFYTCEKSKFEKTKTHFDTEHMFTVRWEADAPLRAAEELKAAIRNEFPVEAVPPDVSGLSKPG